MYLPDPVTDLQMIDTDYSKIAVTLQWTASGSEADVGTGEYLNFTICLYIYMQRHLLIHIKSNHYKRLIQIQALFFYFGFKKCLNYNSNMFVAKGYDIRYSFENRRLAANFRRGQSVNQSMIEGNFNLSSPRASGDSETVTIILPLKGGIFITVNLII